MDFAVLMKVVPGARRPRVRPGTTHRGARGGRAVPQPVRPAGPPGRAPAASARGARERGLARTSRRVGAATGRLGGGGRPGAPPLRPEVRRVRHARHGAGAGRGPSTRGPRGRARRNVDDRQRDRAGRTRGRRPAARPGPHGSTGRRAGPDRTRIDRDRRHSVGVGDLPRPRPPGRDGGREDHETGEGRSRGPGPGPTLRGRGPHARRPRVVGRCGRPRRFPHGRTVGHRRLAPPGTGRDRGREPSGARCPGRRGPPSPSRAAGGGVPELASPFDPARGGTGGARARHGCVGIARPFDARDPLGGPSVPAGPLALRRLGRTLPHAGRGRPARPGGSGRRLLLPPLPAAQRLEDRRRGVRGRPRPPTRGGWGGLPCGPVRAGDGGAARRGAVAGTDGRRDRGSSGGTERDPLVETVVRRSNGRGDLEPYPAEPRHRPAGGLGGAGRRPFDRAVRMDPPPSSPGPGGLGSGRVRDGGRPRDPLARRAGRRGRGRHGDRRPRRRGGPRAAPCPVGRRPRGDAPGGRRGLGSPTAPGRAHGSRPRSPARRAPRGRWSDEPPGRMEAGACAARGQPGPGPHRCSGTSTSGSSVRSRRSFPSSASAVAPLLGR